MSEWQPIETAPIPAFDKERWYSISFYCLGARRGSFLGQIHYGYTSTGKGRWKDAGGYNCVPRFWMPSPAPPPVLP